MSGLDEYRKYTPKNVKKNLISIFLVAGVLIGFYSLSGAITKFLFNIQGTTYDQVEKGADTEYQKVNLDKISIDLADYLDSLLNPDFLESFLQDYLDSTGMTGEEFLNLYGDQLQDLFQGLNGQGMSSNILDEFPPELAAILMAKTMFYVIPINGANPWTQPNETLFKITSYDRYDLSTFEWTLSKALDSESTLPYDSGSSSEQKWMIKSIAQIQEDYKSAIPSVAPTPRIMDYSLSTSPISPTSQLNLKQQAYVGGASVTGSFSANDVNKETNISYTVLYDASDYKSSGYYETESVDMSIYSGSDAVVQACLSGPIKSGAEQTWLQYAFDHPAFSETLDNLEATTEWQLATNTYKKINAILNFIGANFVLNPISTTRPSNNEDPIEWFCQRGESNRPFEFSALAVALARSEGLSVRYTSGYLWQDMIADELGGAYYEDSYLMYPYRIANTYSWIETFIPLTPTTGEWIEFNNRYVVNSTIPPLDDSTSCFNLKFNDAYLPSSAGYLRTEIPNVEINITYNGNSLGNQLVNIYDNTYGKFIGSATTNNFGIASYSMNFANFVSGPHILNFSTQYGDVSFSNFTIVDVVAAVDVNINPIIPHVINSSVDPTFTLKCNGTVIDPNVGNQAVKNARIDFTLHQSTPVNVDRTVKLTLKTNQTTPNGEFFLTSTIQNPSDGTHEIYSNFNGVFDLTNEINSYPQQIRDYLIHFAVWNAHYDKGYVVTDTYADFEIYDYNNCTYTFSINNTLATEPCYGNRDTGLTFQFIATTQQSLFPAEATIQILDLSNANRLICTFKTINGAGNINVSTSVGISQNWTAGPHYLQATWVNCPVSRVESRWVVVIAAVQVYQTSQNYTNQGSGPGGKFFTGVVVDNFTISGCLYDPGTNKNLTTGYTIYYNLRNTYGVSTPYYIMNAPGGNLYQTIAPNQKNYYHDAFYFAPEDGSLTTSAPYYTESYFRMEWYMTTGSWQNSWNDYWRITDSGSYIRNTSISTPFGFSYGYMHVADPTDASFKGYNNNTSWLFQSSYSNDAPIVTDSSKFTVIGQFDFLGVPTVGAWVTFSDVYDRGTLGSNGTKNGTAWGDGYVSFTLNFGSDYACGPHKIQMTLTFDIDSNPGTSNNLSRTIYTWVFYNVTSSSNLEITAYRATWQNLTRGISGSTLTIYGSLKDTAYSKGLMYANVRVAVYDSYGTYVSRSNYFDLPSAKNPIIVSKTGTFDITFYVKAGVNVGNFSVIFYFDGTFSIPTDTSPLYSLTSTGLAKNSSMVPVTVYDQPSITCNFVYAPSGGIVAGVVMNFTGRLTYANGTGINNQNITITIWDEDNSVLLLNSTIVTDANGYYGYTNIKVKSTWNVKSYQIDCARNDTRYIYGCTTGERTFVS